MQNEDQSLNLGKFLLMKRSRKKRIAQHCAIVKPAVRPLGVDKPLKATLRLIKVRRADSVKPASGGAPVSGNDHKTLSMNDNIKDSDIEIVEAWLANKRRRVEIRPLLDYTYRLERNTFILCDIRPLMFKKEGYRTSPFAKIHYLKHSDIYLIYWQRANGRWLSYEAGESASTIQEALAIVDEDVYGCFYG